MDKNIESKIEEIIDELEACDYEKEPYLWNGCEIYTPIYEERVIIGLPEYILVKNGEVRLSDIDEGTEIENYLFDLNNKGKSTEELEQESVIKQ